MITGGFLIASPIITHANSLNAASNPTLMAQTSTATSQSDNDSTPQGVTVLEEIVVTSQKREERLQDVPIPVTAVTAGDLAEKNQFRMQDYYTQIPGLALTPNEFSGSPSIAIRGVTSGDATNPTVGITVDDMPFGSSTSIGGGYIAPDFDPSDLARIEVLRGPQGTLYGASSIGGLVKYVTADPSLGNFSGRVQIGAAGVQHSSSVGYNFSGSVNLPVGDTFAIRASGFTRVEPGYIDNVRTGEKDVNKTTATGGHLSARWEPTDDFSLKLSALVQNNKSHGWPYVTVGANLGDLQQSFLPGTGTLEKKFQAYGATANLNLGEVKLTSVTGYSVNQLTDKLDYTALNLGRVNQAGVDSGDVALQNATAAINTDRSNTYKFNEELRVAMPLGDSIDWLLGVYYTQERSPYTLDSLGADQNGQVIKSAGWSYFVSTYKELAGFTNFTFHVTEQFNVQVGYRSSRINQTFYELDQGPAFDPANPTRIIETRPDENRQHANTYLITPQYKFSDDLMVYARIASGYRPGGINVGIDSTSSLPITFKPDKTENYEVGVKGSALDRALTFEASLYRIDWKDIQLSFVNPDNQQNYFSNGSQAKSEGIELSAEWIPLERVHLGSWISWNRAQLTEAMPPDSFALASVGDRLPYSARLSANVSADYEFPISSLTGFAGTAVSYVGDRQGAFLDLNTASQGDRQEFPAYTKLDIHGGVKTDVWTAQLYLNNLTDKRAILGGGLGTIDPTSFQILQPRTLGVTLSRKF